jgi:hypothetical protein
MVRYFSMEQVDSLVVMLTSLTGKTEVLVELVEAELVDRAVH